MFDDDESRDHEAKLNIFEGADGYYLAWEFPEDIGAELGELYTVRDNCLPPEPSKAENFDEYITWLAEKTALECKPDWINTRFNWETKTGGLRALRTIRAAMKSATADKPWPEWALQASAAGWKPPKGWKP